MALFMAPFKDGGMELVGELPVLFSYIWYSMEFLPPVVVPILEKGSRSDWADLVCKSNPVKILVFVICLPRL